MCGIAGASWVSGGRPIARADLQRMTDAIVHRGPDDQGHYWSTEPGPNGFPDNSSPGAALGFRRLSIIDLAAGHQPLSNEDGSVWIAFNGEIYNYKELRPELEARGHRFATHSDTETIVHLYEEEGLEFVQKLRGMFALAIWDHRQRRLVLARDRAGKKPLIYRHEQDRLFFASEMKSILQVPGIPRDVDDHAVDQFFTYQYVPHPNSILKGFNKLPPGHMAVYENGRLDVRRYWKAPYSPSDPVNNPDLAGWESWSPDRWRTALRETLTESVRLRMRSDVPIGAFLSGGIDSTITAGLMQSLSDRPIHTFSMGFPVKQFDERSFAREAAAHLKTNHHEYLVEPSALESLPKLTWHYDEPFGDSSAIPTRYLAEVTRREVTVALSGDGGDELFAGYERFEAVRLGSKFDVLPQFLRNVFAWKLWQQIPTSSTQGALGRRLKRFASGLADSPERRYLKWITTFDRDRRNDLYSAGFRQRLGNYDSAGFLLSCYADCPDRDLVTRTTCVDVNSYLPCDILNKVDIATMAHSLEARCPFLDHRVMELAAKMPLDLKLRDGKGKRVLLEVFSDLLPQSIQTRPKMGFGVPLAHWFRNELKPLLNDTLLDSTARSRGYFRPEYVQLLIDEHQAEKWDHSYRLWSLIVFERWMRAFVDAKEPPMGPTS